MSVNVAADVRFDLVPAAEVTDPLARLELTGITVRHRTLGDRFGRKLALQAGVTVPDPLQVGLVGYADGTHTVLRPAAEHEQVRAALDGLRAEGGTATGDALAGALDAFGPRGEDRPPAAIVLISDGATTSGRDPVEVAREARAAGIPVSTVALGTPEGTLELPDGRTQGVPPDPESLRQIAQVSGGRAFTAEDAGSLEEVYEDLGSRIGTREETREITAGFAGASILLLVGALATALRWRGRLP